MTNTFTNDETGEKFEVVEKADESWLEGKIVLKPIAKAEEKQEESLEYKLMFYSPYGPDLIQQIDERYSFTRQQAQAVAAAISALMEYVQVNAETDQYVLLKQANTMEAARKLLQDKE